MKLSTLIKSACAKINDFQNLKIEGKSKYGNKKVVVHGIQFDSIREANRYLVLKNWERLGVISDLRLQVPFDLNEGGTHSLKYYADFVYIRNGLQVTEDCKGFKTASYRKKRKLMKRVHGIVILET